jgi:hypothetical protein
MNDCSISSAAAAAAVASAAAAATTAVVACELYSLLETKGLSVCSSDSLYAHENDHSVRCATAIVSSKTSPER